MISVTIYIFKESKYYTHWLLELILSNISDTCQKGWLKKHEQFEEKKFVFTGQDYLFVEDNKNVENEEKIKQFIPRITRENVDCSAQSNSWTCSRNRQVNQSLKLLTSCLSGIYISLTWFGGLLLASSQFSTLPQLQKWSKVTVNSSRFFHQD